MSVELLDRPHSRALSRDLSRMLVVNTLWSHQEAGAIALEPFTETRLGLFPRSGVRARLIRLASFEGIGRHLIAGIARDRRARTPGVEISRLLWTLYGNGKPDAESLVHRQAMESGVELGSGEIERWEWLRETQPRLHGQVAGAVEQVFDDIADDQIRPAQ